MKMSNKYNLENNELRYLMNNVQITTLGNGINPIEVSKEV